MWVWCVREKSVPRFVSNRNRFRFNGSYGFHTITTRLCGTLTQRRPKLKSQAHMNKCRHYGMLMICVQAISRRSQHILCCSFFLIFAPRLCPAIGTLDIVRIGSRHSLTALPLSLLVYCRSHILPYWACFRVCIGFDRFPRAVIVVCFAFLFCSRSSVMIIMLSRCYAPLQTHQFTSNNMVVFIRMHACVCKCYCKCV